MFTSINEQKFFLSHIDSTHNVLEYGSGESTLEIAKICSKIISVEHQQHWYEKIKNQIPSNCSLLFHKPDKEYIEGTHCGTMDEFFSYIHSPISYGPFDIILIDGRARVACSSIVNRLIKNKNSLIFVHDWQRPEYKKVLEYLTLIDECETMAKFTIK